jgi:hypothetical protein
VLSQREPALEPIYGRDAFLVRPDQHIAWRGSEAADAAGSQIVAAALGWKKGH